MPKEQNVDQYRKGVPRRDGSGKGERLNRGRGGCDPPRNKNRR